MEPGSDRTDLSASSRGRLQGTIQILQYNWSFYLIGLVAVIAGIVILAELRIPAWPATLGWIGVALTFWWMAASLIASAWIYDLSDLMSWEWLAHEGRPCAWVLFHAGLDEASGTLTRLWGPPEAVVDFFDPGEMTEPSIIRARRRASQPEESAPVDFRNLPFENDSLQLAALPFAVHELRKPESRDQFFRELARVLTPRGRIVLVEHLRDSANFAAFGPGFLHFMPGAEWRRTIEAAGLRVVAERGKTPFVRLFCIEKP